MEIYFVVAGVLLLALLLSVATFSGANCIAVFKKYDVKKCKSNFNTQIFLFMVKEKYGFDKLEPMRIHGELTDCYVPSKKILAVSDSTYNNTSVAALAVVAHEFGHVFQHKNHAITFYLLKFFKSLFNFLARFIIMTAIAGAVLYFLTEYQSAGKICWYTCVGILGAGLIFRILTIPNEYNASARALKLLESEEILNEDELKSAKKVLDAAALTYVGEFISLLLGITFIKKIIYKRRRFKS